jgi:hypothetical protein
MKNKYNIPLVINNRYIRRGNFIDHYEIKKFHFKRRNISNKNIIIRFGIEITIIKKTR